MPSQERSDRLWLSWMVSLSTIGLNKFVGPWFAWGFMVLFLVLWISSLIYMLGEKNATEG
jgi:hypothetical protein